MRLRLVEPQAHQLVDFDMSVVVIMSHAKHPAAVALAKFHGMKLVLVYDPQFAATSKGVAKKKGGGSKKGKGRKAAREIKEKDKGNRYKSNEEVIAKETSKDRAIVTDRKKQAPLSFPPASGAAETKQAWVPLLVLSPNRAASRSPTKKAHTESSAMGAQAH